MDAIANRVMYVGDTYPAAQLQVSDETGVLDLATATGITVQWIGKTPPNKFSGPGTSIWPATADPDGIHHWNLSYTFTAANTATADTYTPYVVVTWASGEIETFPTIDTLTVVALPA